MPSVFLNIIEKIIDLIGSDDPDQKWVIVGSTGLALHGVNYQPKDIDIITNAAAFKTIQKLFQKNLIDGPKFTKTDLFEATCAKFKVDGTEIEILKDYKICLNGIWEDRNYIVEQHETIYFQGLAVPVPALEDMYQVYSKQGRPKDKIKLTLIEARIQELKTP